MKEMKMRKHLRRLADWFDKNQRVLPWREEPSVYRVWVSEIMLQQTRVDAAIPYFERFMKKFPTLESLAAARVDGVLLAWAGLGYYSRAKNLNRASKIIRKAGKFPQDREGWLALPGVGEYTAGAVLSIALNQPEAILDANVKRVIARLFRPGGKAKTTSDKKIFWDISKRLVTEAYRDHIEPRVINQALMELGALVCLPGNPMCALCPLSGMCESYRLGDTAFLPYKEPKKWLHVRETVFAVVDGQNRVLLTDRDLKWRKGLWDLPEKLPASIKMPSGKGASFTVHYTVTRHKVSRKVLIVPVRSILARAGYRLFPLKNLSHPAIALGSAAKKSLVSLVDKLKRRRG